MEISINYAGDIPLQDLTDLRRHWIIFFLRAFALYGEGVAIGLFPSVWQRSLVNERGLRGFPWWSADTTGYMTDISRVEKTIDTITKDFLSVPDNSRLTMNPIYEKNSLVLLITVTALNVTLWKRLYLRTHAQEELYLPGYEAIYTTTQGRKLIFVIDIPSSPSLLLLFSYYY